MSFLEWFYEPYNPGPVGRIDTQNDDDPDDEDPPKKWQVWLAILIGLLLVGTGLFWALFDPANRSIKPVLYKLGGLTLYVLVSRWLTPKPDYTNMGWFGGLVDNPFRISDDYNRMLAFLLAILFPGKLMAYSLTMTWIILGHLSRKLPKKPDKN